MMPHQLGSYLMLLQLLLLTRSAVPQGEAPSVELFNFDYTWSPHRPVVNDTVIFQAAASRSNRWNLTEDSFRWYQQLPSSGFHLRHVGRSYTRRASETYFEGRYRLRVVVERGRRRVESPARERQDSDSSDLLVDVVKYVGLQRQIDIALLTNASNNSSRSGSGSHRHLTCRFWGWPLVDSLQFLPPPGSVCDQQHFETAEAEPYIDLVMRCPRLLPGAYSCYGRNSVSASQLTCELLGPDLTEASCYRPVLGESESVAARDAPASASTGTRRSNQRSSSQSQQSAKAAHPLSSGAIKLQGFSMVAMATNGLVLFMLLLLES